MIEFESLDLTANGLKRFSKKLFGSTDLSGFFGMKLGNHNGTKLTEPDFSGKFLFWVFGAKRVQKGPKIGSLSFFSRLLHYFF